MRPPAVYIIVYLLYLLLFVFIIIIIYVIIEYGSPNKDMRPPPAPYLLFIYYYKIPRRTGGEQNHAANSVKFDFKIGQNTTEFVLVKYMRFCPRY